MQKGNTRILLGGPVLQHPMEKSVIRVDVATKVPLAHWKRLLFSGEKKPAQTSSKQSGDFKISVCIKNFAS